MSDIQPKVTQGNTILLSDYNNIQTKIATVLGTGSGQSGYGQTVSSSQLSAKSVIDDAHWDNLRTDLLKARQHQTGADESTGLTDIAAGQLIDDAVITAYETFATTVVNNKFAIASNQIAYQPLVSTAIGVWNGTRTATVTFSFASADAARYFFNSGSYLRITGQAGLNDPAKPKDYSWYLMTAAEVGTIGVGYNYSISTNGSSPAIANSSLGFYNLTNSYQRIVSKGAAAGVYVENRYYIDIACDVTSNTSGGATKVYVRVSFEDNDLGDQTGTGAAVDENISAASVSADTIYAYGTNVQVATPTITIPAF